MDPLLQAGGYEWSLCRSRGFGRRANDLGEVSCGLESGPRRAAESLRRIEVWVLGGGETGGEDGGAGLRRCPLLLTGKRVVLLECLVQPVKVTNWQTNVGKVRVESTGQETGVLRVSVSAWKGCH